MKRGMGGGTYRGPVHQLRQRRAIRFMQFLLIAIAAALLLFAGYSWGLAAGFEQAQRDDVDAPRKPGVTQVVVLAALGGIALVGALLLQGGSENVRIPTPAALDELAERAEAEAVERAEKVARDSS